MKKANLRKTGKYLAAAALLSSVMSSTALAGYWTQGGTGWLYVHDDGRTSQSEWIQDGGRYYRINESGLMHTGWYQDLADGGRWYYLDPNQGGPQGAMMTGWVMDSGRWYFLDTRIGGPQGAMMTGWQWIDGKCYYLDPAQGGALVVSGTTPDGYTVDANGAWVDGNGNPVYEAGKGIPSIAGQSTAGTAADGVSFGGGSSSGGSGSGGSSGSNSVSYTYSDSEWDDYSDASIKYAVNDFENGNFSKMDSDQWAETEAAIEDFKDEYITDDMSDFEKEIMIIKWLVENCEYEKGESWENSTAYSCIVKGEAQCAGYADAFLQTAKACGLEVRYVYNQSHAWNLVELDGDWYHVDVTWEDPIGSNDYGFDKLRNKYINLEDSQIKGVNYHHDWQPDSISADGTDYGPEVVAQYLESGEIDTSLGESFEDTMDDFFDSVSNADGSNMFEYDGVNNTADAIIEYLAGRLDEKADNYSFVVRYPESYNATKTGNYSKLVDLNNEIEERVNQKINRDYEDVLRSDVKISLLLKVDADSCYYAHENGAIYYKEGQGRKIPYTVHFIDKETGEEVGTQSGTGEKRQSIRLEFPEGYSWISNAKDNYEVNDGKASYGGTTINILGNDELDMDVKLRRVASEKQEAEETKAAEESKKTEKAEESKKTEEAEIAQEAKIQEEEPEKVENQEENTIFS